VTLKIGILSRLSFGYSVERLREACYRRGHRVRVLDTLQLSPAVGQGAPLLYRNKPLSRFDAVIARIGPSVSSYGTAVVEQFEHAGVATLPNARAIRVCRDKFRALQVLSRHGLPVPATVLVRDRAGVRAAVAAVGGVPVILKPVEGSQGTGVILAETTRLAEAVVETLLLARKGVLVQHFVKESRGRDLRVLVVGARVVASMQRRAAPDEFRSNVHRGGRIEKTQLAPELVGIAERAALVLGAGVAGVDLIESRAGPLVLEVNSSPGLEGIERATGADVASAVLEHLENVVGESRSEVGLAKAFQ
jgi:ribosomal protein S6--L-glutamate ligase